MAGLIFKPLVSSDVGYLKGEARRMANSVLAGRSDADQQVIDGYLLKAVRNRDNVIVYVLDPAAVWVLLQHGDLDGAGAYLHASTRFLNRGQLQPGVPLDVDPRARSLDTLLLTYSPGQGYYQTIDAGALFLRTNFPSLPFVIPQRAGCTVLASTSGNNPARFTDRFQLWADVMDATFQPKVYKPDADTSQFVGNQYRMLNWFLPESALQLLTGDPVARYYTRQNQRYVYTIPTFGGQVAREGFGSWEIDTVRWGETSAGGAYVSQPNSSDGSVDPTTDPARLGVAGVFLAKFLRPAVPPSNSYTLTNTSNYHLLMKDNPEPELAPVLVSPAGVDSYEPHGVSGAALCYTLDPDAGDPPDGAGARGQIALFWTCYRVIDDGLTITTWTGVQLRRQPSTGVGSNLTLYKGTDNRAHQLGPELVLFGVPGVVGTTHTFTVDNRPDQATVDLVHYGTDGVIRTTNLRAAGWYAFTQVVVNPSTSTTGSFFGQASQFATAMGNNKVAVLAKNSVVPVGASTVAWTLVVIDQTTGEFIEARGEVGSTFPLTYDAHLNVVTPEVEINDVVTPAVLAAAVGSNHYISTDGGVTWEQFLDDFAGCPVYLGNQLHPIQFRESL